MEMEIIPFLLYQAAALFGAFGQALYKLSMDRRKQHIGSSWLLYMVAGIIVYCAVIGLFIAAFWWGGSLALLYATYATTFIWGLILGHLFFKEAYTPQKIIGVAIILSGVGILYGF